MPETDVSPATPNASKSRPAFIDRSVREVVKTLYISGVSGPRITAETGVKQATIRTWAARFKWVDIKRTQQATAKQAPKEALVKAAASTLGADSEAVRRILADVVRQQASTLAGAPISSVNQLRNTPEGQGLASVAKTLAETASTVFDWREGQAVGVVVMGELAETDDDRPAIDVQADIITPEQSNT